MLAGEENLHVEVVAETTSEIEQSTNQLDELGLRIVSSDILADERIQPWNHFHQKIVDDADTLAEEESAEQAGEE